MAAIRERIRGIASGAVRRLLNPVSGSIKDRGWAVQTLATAMRVQVLNALAAMHLLVVAAVAFSGLDRGEAVGLCLGHSAGLAVAVLARLGRLPTWSALVAADLLFLADWSLTPSMLTPLLFAACWLRNLSAAAPAFTVEGRLGLLIPTVSLITLPVLMVLIRPDLPALLPQSVVVTALAIVAATRIGVSHLFDLATLADRESELADSQRRTLAVHRAAASAAAEDARTLHDTVINTLAAVAAGGAAIRDLESVRTRCRHDIARVEALDAGEVGATPTESDLTDLPPIPGIHVSVAFADDPEFTQAARRLDPVTRAALRASVVELVQNSAKHSGADEVRVTGGLRRGTLSVDVIDDGIGFDGVLPVGRGLARSVLERCQAVGIDVHIATSPGNGTQVTMTLSTAEESWSRAGGPTALGPHRWPDDFAGFIRRATIRAGFLLAAGLAAVGLALAFSNHGGHLNPEHTMVALIALTVGAAWPAARAGREPPPVTIRALVLAGPAAFVLSGLAVDMGRSDPVLWQAVGPTAPYIVLVALGSNRTAPVSAALYLVAVTGCATATLGSSTQATAIVVIAGVVGLGLMAAWRRFVATMATIGARTMADQSSRRRAGVESAARAAAERVRERWRAAGLNQSLQLLRQIAEGDLDPRSPTTQRACAREETHLRQLTLISPHLVNLGGWLMQCLGRAHDRGAELTVHAGDRDVDPETATTWGTLILAVLDEVRTDEKVTVTIFPGPAGLALVLAGPGAAVERGLARRKLSDPAPAVQRLSEISVVELAAT